MDKNTFDFEATLASRVRHTRRSHELTQDQLAKKVGTNQPVIQKIENGKSLMPRCITSLAKALDVNPAWLLFGPDYANKKLPKLSKLPQ